MTSLAFSPSGTLELNFEYGSEILSELPQGVIWQYLYDGETVWRQFEQTDSTPEENLPTLDPEIAALYSNPSWSRIVCIRSWQLWRDRYLDALQQERIAMASSQFQGIYGTLKSSHKSILPLGQSASPDYGEEGYWSHALLQRPLQISPSGQSRLNMQHYGLFMQNHKMEVQNLPHLAAGRERGI